MDNELSKKKGRHAGEGTVTLREVAERAGVHPATVSRALQGDERVAPATLQNIQRIAREMNYTPNIAARVLAKGKTETIAIATGPSNEHYYAEILHYLEQELTASNYKRLVLSSQDLKRDLLSIVNTNAVDGVIAVDAFPQIDDLMNSPSGPVLPCVYAGISNVQWTRLASVDIVKVDLSYAVREAVQAMLDTGCRRVAYVICGSQMGLRTEVRADTYETTLEAAGRQSEIIDLDVSYSEPVYEVVLGRLAHYIEKHGCPDGLLCQNDEVAMLVHRASKDLGLRIPDDVQIVGCDGLRYVEYFDPPISSIVQPAQHMCALAWRFLHRRIHRPYLARQQANLRAKLVRRGSLKAG